MSGLQEEPDEGEAASLLLGLSVGEVSGGSETARWARHVTAAGAGAETTGQATERACSALEKTGT